MFFLDFGASMLCEKIVVYIRLGLYLVAKKLKITEIIKLPVLVYYNQAGTEVS